MNTQVNIHETVTIDAGNNGIKYGIRLFASPKVQWHKVVSTIAEVNPHSDLTGQLAEEKDMVELEIDGKTRYFVVGERAKYYKNTVQRGITGGDSKNHLHGMVRIMYVLSLLASRKGLKNFNLVTCNPYGTLQESRKGLEQKLLGVHKTKIGGRQVEFNVRDLMVVSEGFGALYISECAGFDVVRLLDVGSYTINYLTSIDYNINITESGTIKYGLDSHKDETTSFGTVMNLLNELIVQFDRSDLILVTGGKALEIVDAIKSEIGYTNVIAARPNDTGFEFGNCAGNYQLYLDKNGVE